MEHGSPYRFAPVTSDRLDDLERFSRAHGKFRYCSCMRWRLRSSQYRDAGRDGRVAELTERARSGQPTGILAYHDEDVVGWCSIAPRETYAAILASRVIPTVGGTDVWSVVCFFVTASHRRSGLPPQLLNAGCAHAARSGASIVEAYPWPGGASYRYMGTAELYRDADFRDVAVPAGQRRVMRRLLAPREEPRGQGDRPGRLVTEQKRARRTC